MEKPIEKIAKILNEINNDLKHHKSILNKYKRAHCILYKTQLILNTTSLACGSSTAITLLSGLAPGAIVLSVTASISAGIGIFANILDKNVLKKIHKHYQLCVLARTLDLKVFEKHLFDNEISEHEFKDIMEMINKYFQSKDLIMTKSIFVSSSINQLAQEFNLNNGNGIKRQ